MQVLLPLAGWQGHTGTSSLGKELHEGTRGGDIITASLGLWVMLKGSMVGEVGLCDHLGIALPAILFRLL